MATDETALNDRLISNVGEVRRVVAFTEDAAGNIYTVAFGGQIYRLDPRAGAGDGADELHGGSGDDALYGGPGADLMFGDDDDDLLSGGFGADILEGGAGNDDIRGDAGGDTAWGGVGSDDFRGGAGADVLEFRQGDGRDRFLDFDTAADRVDLSAFGFADADEALSYARDILATGAVSFVFVGGDQLIVADTTMAELSDLLII